MRGVVGNFFVGVMRKGEITVVLVIPADIDNKNNKL